MARRRSAKPRKERKKVVKVQYLPRPDKKKKPDPGDPYGYLDSLVSDVHDDLQKAKIAVVWMLDVKPDRDGRLKLGNAKKATDLDREITGGTFDLVVQLNAAAWKSFTVPQKVAVMDHFLCRFTVATDKNDNPILDERERSCYRMRQPDIVEFTGVVARHGTYLHDIAKFVRTATEAPLFPADGEEAKGK
jgi:hypothetical protein